MDKACGPAKAGTQGDKALRLGPGLLPPQEHR